MGFACRIWRSSRPSRPNFELRETFEEVDRTEFVRVCAVTVLRLKDALRGRPTVGIMETKEFDAPMDGDCECPGLPSEGACVSVAIAARYWITFLVLSVFPAPDSPL